MVGEVGVTDGGEDGLMPEDSLHFQQVDACFDQVGGIGMAQTVWRNSFLNRNRG